MIAEMKKVTLAVLSRTSLQSLERLRDIGVLHVQPVRQPESEDVEDLKGKVDLVEKALYVLSARKGKRGQTQTSSPLDTADEILSIKQLKSEYEERRESLIKIIERLTPLGDFSPADFETLRRKGLTAKIYEGSKKELGEVEISVPHAVVGTEGSRRYILAVSKEDFSLPFEEIPVPESGLDDLRAETEVLGEKIGDLDRQLDLHTVHAVSLRETLSLLKEQVEFAEVAAGLGQEGSIAYVQGFCPSEDLETLRRRAEEMHWGVMIEEPCPEEEVPTLIKNPSWIRVIQPVFDLMGARPGYREYDVSLWFLISLCLFFAMLVGDGGYGFLFLLATSVVRRRLKSARGEAFFLLYVFSGATIVWGAITGTWFGIEGLSRFSFLEPLIVENLNSYSDNQDFMIQLCFLLGAGHLTIAHIIRGFRFINEVKAIGEIGWICILWFLYFLAGHLVLGKAFPDHGRYLILIGLPLAALFSKPQKHFLKSSLLGFAELPLKVITSFSDLVSYIRLFAVGYATLVVAVSFNQMAVNLGGDPLLKSVGAVFVLLFGHTLNILLAAMAVLVHGVRLNMLEFSSHLGMGWTGRPYRPFQRSAKNRSRE